MQKNETLSLAVGGGEKSKTQHTHNQHFLSQVGYFGAVSTRGNDFDWCV